MLNAGGKATRTGAAAIRTTGVAAATIGRAMDDLPEDNAPTLASVRLLTLISRSMDPLRALPAVPWRTTLTICLPAPGRDTPLNSTSLLWPGIIVPRDFVSICLPPSISATERLLMGLS
jgi:hypothetical protein